jgi:hypothetical protein
MASCLAVLACDVQLGRQTSYAGDLPDCVIGPTAHSTLVVEGNHFSFAPSDGALIISGTVQSDGTFAGSMRTDQPGRGGRDASGARAAPYTLSVTGQVDRALASGEFATPRCRSTFRLPRVGPNLRP